MEKSKERYQGIIPAFYACYDEDGEVSAKRVEALVSYFVEKGVKGVYVGGSSGECLYQSIEERKLTLEHVMKVAAGKLTVIAHVACNNTRDSQILAAHAESLGVDAVAAIPPIYFHLAEHAIAQYWNDISAAAPNTDFVIYNIPQLAGVALTMPLFREMRKNPRVRAVKNSSVPVTDIQMFKMEGGEDFIVLNGPDEQLISGLAMGADGGIGGTYGVMPELYIKMMELFRAGKMKTAMSLQDDVDRIIYAMCGCHGNLYAVMKEILRRRTGIDIGSVRKPMPGLIEEDMAQVEKCVGMIDDAVRTYC
ncbi:dihydrodipicolinate synthase family protein [Acetatifactor aquisgranensis]|uniref:dihydrodipicolinate synthase family protein n=1 Tax=Acetatifactor aquisgranensis TaxID=2941233 RepID=UPI00203A6220|nr:dihydrodipicolinate synthase family protein [Acetatifactor aquisgranensis]MCI8542478.1 N-acetylneuraminate lyase [Lachnospiraceae bacterium]